MTRRLLALAVACSALHAFAADGESAASLVVERTNAFRKAQDLASSPRTSPTSTAPGDTTRRASHAKWSRVQMFGRPKRGPADGVRYVVTDRGGNLAVHSAR